MKLTEYNEHIRNIKCSEEFKAEMEKKLSLESHETHEYEDSVHGVERAGKFNVSRFAALAAALVIIGGGVGFGIHGIKNIRITNPMYGEEQAESIFPYSELKDLHNGQQVHGDIKWENHNEKITEQLVQSMDSRTGPMSDIQLDTLFEFFDMDEWHSVDPRDMSDRKSNLVIILHPDGYERFTGVYYLFQIYENGDAYFIKYDMSDDSLSNHIVSEYCYMFTEDTFIRYRELLRMNCSDELYSSVKNMNIHYLFCGNMEYNNIESSGLTSDVSDETKNSMKDMILKAVKSSSCSEIDYPEVEYKLNGNFVTVGYDDNTEGAKMNSILVTDRGEMIFYNNNEDAKSLVYDVGTDFYEAMKNLVENNKGTGNYNYEIVQQDIINEIIDENIKAETFISINSPLLMEGINQKYISEAVTAENIEEVKNKMKSVQWEKCDDILAYTDEYKDCVRQFLWGTVCFNDKGLLYNGAEFCYRPANKEDVKELVNMIYSNTDKLSPEMKLMMSLSEGYNFSNLKGSYSALHEVPAEISETGESYYVQSEGTIYIDKSIYGIIAEGEGFELKTNEPRRYCYIEYAADNKVRYDEARGEGESTAHYNGELSNDFHELNYFVMYRGLVNFLGSHLGIDEWECIQDGNESNDTGLINYAFTMTENNIKKTINIFVDEQGKLIEYILIAEDGHTIEKFELHNDCVFDSDDFAMPDTYRLNNIDDPISATNE